MKNNQIYLDNGTATRLDERVLEEMKPYFFDTYAVATSDFAYSMGIEAKEALGSAREVIASELGGSAGELIFTSGATESSNLAVKGTARGDKKGNHIITSKIEDFPVLHSVEKMEKEGFEATYLDVDGEGYVDMEQLKESITDDTKLVTIQHANQEIGTVQDIEAIAEICEDEDVLFHTDGTHTFTRIPFDVQEIPIDLVTVSPHTIHGPKGIGGLYVREETPLKKQMDGGFQENNLRAGVENIPGAVGFKKAVELVTHEENKELKDMRDELMDRLVSEVPNVTRNGPEKKRTPQNVNVTFHQVEGESITLHMDMRGFSVSTGSACFSKSLEASHVITGIGGDHERAHGSVRFTFGRFNEKDDIGATVEAVKEVVEELREISPLAGEGGGEL